MLLEDTIVDPAVLKLYKTLKATETSGNRTQLEELLNDTKFITIIEQVRETYSLCKDDIILTNEQKDLILQKLSVGKNDAASLLLIVAAALTQLFVIANFMGPPGTDSEGPHDCLDVYRAIETEFDYRTLTLDGYEVYHLVEKPWLFKAAQICWTILSKLGVSRRLKIGRAHV